MKELILAGSRPILRKPPILCYKKYFFCYCITVYVGVLMFHDLVYYTLSSSKYRLSCLNLNNYHKQLIITRIWFERVTDSKMKKNPFKGSEDCTTRRGLKFESHFFILSACSESCNQFISGNPVRFCVVCGNYPPKRQVMKMVGLSLVLKCRWTNL